MEPVASSPTGALSANRAFARLEELVALIPTMQEKGDLLSRAREARELMRLHEQARVLEAEVEGYQKTIDQALWDAKQAAGEDDAAKEGRSLALVRVYSEMHMTRVAPMQRAQNELAQALRKGTLTRDDPLEEYALPDEEFEALNEAIRAFQEEYGQVYALCQQLAGV